jgi:phosphatidylinositol glycan class S
MDKSKDPKEQFILSRDAVGLANKAFFDPSMMGLLYFVSTSSPTMYELTQ